MDKLKNWIQENIHQMDVEEPNAALWDRLKQGLSKPAKHDPLKTHIAENRNELEIETPAVQAWKKISSSISTQKPAHVQHLKKRIFYYLSAACVLFIIGLGVFRYVRDVPARQGEEVVKNPTFKNNSNASDTINIEANKNQLTATPSLPDEHHIQTTKHKTIAVTSLKPAKKQQRKSLPPEVLQVKKDYDELIAEQIKYTKSLALYGENASYFQEFMNDFKALENQEKELRKSIAQSGLKENSIDDLAMIYQQKLTVLKKLQNEINKTSNCNKNVTDTIPAYISL